MRVTCPSCLAQYELPAEIAAATPAAGRRLRCAACGHVWHQSNPDAASPDAATPHAIPPDPGPDTGPHTVASTAAPPEPHGRALAEPETLAATRPLVAPLDSADPALRSAVPAPARPGPASGPGSAPAISPAGRPAASVLVWAGWAGSVAIVLAVLALLWIERVAVMRAVPATAPIYGALAGAAGPAARPAAEPARGSAPPAHR